MRILHVIHSVNPANGGPIEGIRQLSSSLLSQYPDVSVEIASLDAPQAPCLTQIDARVHALGPGIGSYGYCARLIPWLRNHVSDYDAVIINGVWQFNSLGTHLALRDMGTPYYVYTHGMLDPYFKRRFPLKHLKKQLYWRWGEHPVLSHARAVCFTCDEERLLARESFAPYKVREAVLNYGTAGAIGDAEGQKTAFFDVFPDLRGRRLLVFLSRIHPKKGCDLLIEAFAKVVNDPVQRCDNSLQLVMAGPDQSGWQAELMARAQTLGIAHRITWTGMVSGDVKWGALRAAEAFVLPSHQENFGIAVAEALSCGTPVLISRPVNIWREIAEANAGLVEDTELGTERLLQQWLILSPEQKATMSINARAVFLDKFEIGRAAQSLYALLSQGVGMVNPLTGAGGRITV